MRNPLNQLRQILGEATTTIGTVTTSADGAVTVLLEGGGTLMVKGSAASGAKVYIRDGSIVGPAPDLPTFPIEI